jgi:hypothetical protein
MTAVTNRPAISRQMWKTTSRSARALPSATPALDLQRVCAQGEDGQDCPFYVLGRTVGARSPAGPSEPASNGTQATDQARHLPEILAFGPRGEAVVPK